jgi:DNA-directed RNA polymerase specialized sigma24 family protein
MASLQTNEDAMPAIEPETCIELLHAAASFHANRIAGTLRLSPEDRKDVFQAIAADICAGLQRHDATRAALSTFISLLASHSACGNVRRYQRWRREIAVGLDPQTSLAGSDKGSPSELLNVNPSAPTGTDAHDPASPSELAIDVARAVAALPPQLRSICRLLQAHEPTAARRSSGLSHATFYRRIQCIRAQFVGRGLDAYA